MKDYLCYFELHVGDRTFPVHVVVSSETADKALGKLESQYGDDFHLQAKGCLGTMTPMLYKQFMSLEEVTGANAR